MNGDDSAKAVLALTAISPWFGLLGLVATVGLNAVKHANELAKLKADPTPEEIDRLLEKVGVSGEELIPLRPEVKA